MHGLYLLFWVQERGLSPALVAAALAAGDLAIMLFEVPTGWVADRWGPRTSLVIGSLVQVAGMLSCWLAPGVYSLILATPLIALGDAFRSGADHALLYRTCAALGCADDFRRIEARTHAVTQVCLVVLVLAGGLLVARWGFAAGWIAESLLCAVGLVLALMMEDPPPPAGGSDEEGAGGRAESWRLLMAPRLIRAVLPASIVGAAASAASFVAQTGGDASPESVTVLVAALALAEAGGSMLGARPVRYVRPAALLVLAAVAVAAAVASPLLLGPAALVLATLAGAAHPSRAAMIQNLVSDTVRARAASLASACDMALSTITLPLTGLFRTRG